MNENLITLLTRQKLFPIIRSDDPKDVTAKVNAVLDSGLKVMEVIVENGEIYKTIKSLSDRAIICAGGIITSMQAQAAIMSGAKIISSPVFHMNLVKLSKDAHIPYLAGTTTANEAYQAWKARIPLLKIYPISALGGVSYFENLLRPMNFLNVIVQGGVKLSEVKDYVKVGAVAVGVGRNLFADTSYSDVTKKINDIVAEL